MNPTGSGRASDDQGNNTPATLPGPDQTPEGTRQSEFLAASSSSDTQTGLSKCFF